MTAGWHSTEITLATPCTILRAAWLQKTQHTVSRCLASFAGARSDLQAVTGHGF